MSKVVLSKLGLLFFPSSQKTISTLSPPRYCVQGSPPGVVPTPHDFKVFKNQFHFVEYQEAIAAGLARWKAMFGSLGGVDLHKLGRGRDLQWFRAQLVDDGNQFKIDGDYHHPSFTIEYGYDAPTYVKFRLGVYRSRCTNGLIFGFKDLGKRRVRGEHLWDLDPLFLRCLWAVVIKEYEAGVKVLKGTKVDRHAVRTLAEAHLREGRGTAALRLLRHGWEGRELLDRDQIESEVHIEDGLERLVEKYTGTGEHGVGENAFAALNVVTDIASHYFVAKRIPKWKDSGEVTETVSQALFAAQEAAGTWFDDLVGAIRDQNEVRRRTDIDDVERDDFGEYLAHQQYQLDVESFVSSRQ